MVRRLTIGLRYKHQDEWVGGVYYVQNLVRALGLLPETRRPTLAIVGGDKAALEGLKAATGYPDLLRLSRARLHPEPAPLVSWPVARRPAEEMHLLLMGAPPGLEDRGVQWIPDFQEHRFPEFFPADELQARYRRNAQWLSRHRHVMVSSQDVASDVGRYYAGFGNRVHVVRFASFLPADIQNTDVQRLRGLYGLPERYFLCANQLWRHKNHAVALRALAAIDEAERPFVAFTGKEDDYRDPQHAPGIRRLVAELGLEDRVRFLGFLPREDQLGLMRGAVCVVQPSLCEGWSTVVEDAKALGRHVLASDIAVHREQLERNADFFPPHEPAALAALLRRYARADPEVRPLDYQQSRRRFAEDLWRMIREVERDLSRRRVYRLMIRN